MPDNRSSKAPPYQGGVGEVSADAQRLLYWLRRSCASREHARTDRELSHDLQIPEREIIELRRELVAAGHIVVSENTRPQGAWLLLPGADLASAHAYAQRLKDRGVDILAGFWKPLTKAIAAEEARRQVESNGQRRLFA